MDPFGLQETIDLLVMPFIGVLVMLIVTLWIKDFAAKMAKGIMFSMNKSFQEGDKVILDGEEALIVKIGMTQTVFGVTKSEGIWDGDYVWRYVPNDRHRKSLLHSHDHHGRSPLCSCLWSDYANHVANLSDRRNQAVQRQNVPNPRVHELFQS